MDPDQSQQRAKRFFAVAAVGKGRWYWVVWPALEALQGGSAAGHVAAGYEASKAEAVDQALAVAGLHGEWVEAKYARSYHRQQSRTSRQTAAETGAAPARLAFLYRDVQDPDTGEWLSLPHRVVRQTSHYVYVEQQPYDPARLSGSWLDHQRSTFRLSRLSLEQEGYALAPLLETLDDPLFFTHPYPERLAQHSGQAPDCFKRLNLPFPCTVAEVKAAYRRLVKQVHPDRGGHHDEFLALQAAYEQALRLCRYTP
jgi:hypothetical protein